MRFFQRFRSLPQRIAGATLFVLLSITSLGIVHGAEGDIDVSFRPPRPNGWVNHIRVLDDDRILIAGTFSSLGGTPRKSIARLMPHGELDPTFDPGTGPDGPITHFDIDPEGRILIVGPFTKVNGQPRNGWARLTKDGAFDPSYASAQPFLILSGASRGSEIHALPDGRSLMTGPTVIFTLAPMVQRAGAMMLKADGTCDASFNLTIPNVVGAVPVSGEKFLVFGLFSTTGSVVRNSIARVDALGALDPTFEAPVDSKVYGVLPVFTDSTGRVVYVHSDGTSTRMYRSSAEGAADAVFQPPALNGAVMDCAFQADGKLVIGGDFHQVNTPANSSPRLARLNADGTFDSEFRIGHGGSSSVLAVAIQSDGRLLVGGAFTTWNDTDYVSLVRLMASGGPPPPPSPHLADPTVAAGTFTVSVPTQAGSQYLLEFRTTMGSGDWSAASPSVPGDGAVKMLSHTPTGDHGFYRVSVQ